MNDDNIYYTEIEVQIADNEVLHLVKFDDEDEINVNLLIDGKLKVHDTTRPTPALLRAFELNEGEIGELGGRKITILNKTRETL